MPVRRNKAEFYDTKTKQPGGKGEGLLKLGDLEPAAEPKKVGMSGRGPWPGMLALAGLALALTLTGTLLIGKRPTRNDE
jgi:hypothetical protein